MRLKRLRLHAKDCVCLIPKSVVLNCCHRLDVAAARSATSGLEEGHSFRMSKIRTTAVALVAMGNRDLVLWASRLGPTTV